MTGTRTRISIVRWRTLRTHHAALPFRLFRRQLADHGFEVRSYSSPDDAGVFDCDVVLLIEGSYRSFLPPGSRERSDALLWIDAIRKRASKLVWFDGADSSGRLRTYVFPYVDMYLKSHVLRDRTIYQQPSITGDPHRDFYIQSLGLTDNMHQWKGPVTDGELGTLFVGWNVGLGDWTLQGQNRPIYEVGLRVPLPQWWRLGTRPLEQRAYDVSYRVGLRHLPPTIEYQRREVGRRLENLANRGEIQLVPGGFLPRRRYLRELRESRVAPSPFGMGEVCYRDFEAFRSGCVLLKPDMSHMETWPPYYEDGVTYVAHRWDLTDFEEKLQSILQNPSEAQGTADAGMARFLDSRSTSGGRRFAERFLDLMERL